MRFIASLDTRIYGVPYAQGALVDTTGWARKQLLQFLASGIIAPADLNSESVGDVKITDLAEMSDLPPVPGYALVWSGVDWGPRVAVSNLKSLTDVDLQTDPPTDGQTLVYDAVNDIWVPGTVSGGGGGGTGILVNLLRLVPVTATVNGANFGQIGSLTDGAKGTSYVQTANSANMNLVVDLGSPLKLSKARGYWYPDSRTYAMVGIDVSVDGVTWVVARAKATMSFNGGLYAEGTIDPTVGYRYLRFHSEGSSVNSGNEMTEIEAYGLLAQP